MIKHVIIFILCSTIVLSASINTNDGICSYSLGEDKMNSSDCITKSEISCGNNVCEKGENTETCKLDCKKTMGAQVSCLFNKEDCIIPGMADNSGAIYIGVFILAMIFMRIKGLI